MTFLSNVSSSGESQYWRWIAAVVLAFAQHAKQE